MQLSFLPQMDSRLPAIRDRLLELSGPQRGFLRPDPVPQFILALIGTRTRDAVSEKAVTDLHAALRSWENLPEADPDAIAAMIGDVRFAADKAVRLVAAARMISLRRGSLDLDFLNGWPVEDALAWLRRLPGVRTKVAAATLNFSALRKRAFVVDTHVLRVSICLGLLPARADFEAGYRLLMRRLPNDWDADDLFELHWLMKLHGQTICRPRPGNGACPLARFCRREPAVPERDPNLGSSVVLRTDELSLTSK
jgi:endonuclease-3